MNSFFWLLAVIGSILVLISTSSAVAAAIGTRKYNFMAMGIAAGLLHFTVAFASHSAIATLVCAIVVWFATRWMLHIAQPNQHRAETTTKLTAAHITLIAGSILFMIPFAWLISTSLKSDDEMSKFPPVWIPTQQIAVPDIKRADDLPAGISMYQSASDPKAPALKVVEVADLPTGDTRVRVLEPADQKGKEFDAKRDELTKVRHVAPRWENYSEALRYLPESTYHGLLFLGNTLFLTLMSTIGTLLGSSIVAYSFARLNWPGRNIWFGVLLATMMIPGAVTMMPQFLIYRTLGWYDTLLPLWVPAFFGSAFNIFLLRQFFMSIPKELEDAAKIDGCTPFGIYWQIMLPLVKPALTALAIMTILGSWNNFQGPLIYLSSPEKMPLAYALQLYQTAHGGEPGLLMAASTLVVLPIIALFFFTQRYFIEGVSLTGLGGR